MNDPTTMYQAVPVVSELNRVPGFDPLRFLRQTKNGPKLDLKIKKLWFRLKHPNGRIKLSTLKITDQLAIFEARIYFDKADTEPVASFTAQRDNSTTPGGLYIEMAQHCAIDEALSAAGFGVQFTPVGDTVAPASGTLKAMNDRPAQTATQKKAPPTPHAPVSTIPDETAAAVAVEDTTAETQIAVESVAETVKEEVTPAEEVAPAEVVPTESIPETVVTPTEDAVTEIHEEEASARYTKDMSVEAIGALMTEEEAGNLIVPIGTCKGWTLSQVKDRRPASLKWFIGGYAGDDNILRAAATIMLKVWEREAA